MTDHEVVLDPAVAKLPVLEAGPIFCVICRRAVVLDGESDSDPVPWVHLNGSVTA